MSEALQVSVRAFGSVLLGERIAARLEAFGFELNERIQPNSDTLGGLTETHIADTATLETEDVEEIKRALYSIDPNTPLFIQWRRFQVTEESNV
jgi:hypothetical protein